MTAIYTWDKAISNRIAMMNEEDFLCHIQKGDILGHIFRHDTLASNSTCKEKVETLNKSESSQRDNLKRLIEDLGLEDNEVLSTNPQLKEDVKKLVMRYKDVFSKPGNEVSS